MGYDADLERALDEVANAVPTDDDRELARWLLYCNEETPLDHHDVRWRAKQLRVARDRDPEIARLRALLARARDGLRELYADGYGVGGKPDADQIALLAEIEKEVPHE